MKLSNASLGVCFAFLVALSGCSGASPGADENVLDTPSSEDELRKATDSQIRFAIVRDAKDAVYVSETDAGFTFVSAELGPREAIDQKTVRSKFEKVIEENSGSLSEVYSDEKSFRSWRSDHKNCEVDTYPGPKECAAIEKLNATLERHLTGIKVFYFGQGGPGNVEGSVTILIVGRSPSGRLLGVQTFAAWT